VPTDLDELFSALGRQADALPLAPAADARQRGIRRRRTRAMLAGAAAVLAVAGVGAAVWRVNPGPRPVPAAPAASIRGMTPVGSPIAAGGKKTSWTQTVTSDGRLYAAAETPDGESKVVAIDPETAKILWETAPFDPFYDYNGPIAVPGALLVTGSATIEKIPTLHVLDPDTGTTRWRLQWRTPDEVVVGDGVLARMTAATGVTEAYDLRTGAPLWSSPAGEDRPAHLLGMQSGGYDEVGNLVGPDITISDDGLVQITRGGQVLLRDIRTGALRVTVPAALPSTLSRIAYDGRLFIGYQTPDKKQYKIGVTDLTGTSGTSRVVYTVTGERGVGGFLPCGPRRLCLSQFMGKESKSMVVSIDTETQKALWTAGLRTQVNGYMYARGSHVLRGDIAETGLYDANGRTVYAGAGDGRWIDDDNVLWTEWTKPDYTVSVIAAKTGRKVELGTIPNRTGNCSWTSEFLACPVGFMNPFRSELRIWRFTR
jgi:outer membrane protein assembly factor BamB